MSFISELEPQLCLVLVQHPNSYIPLLHCWDQNPMQCNHFSCTKGMHFTALWNTLERTAEAL